LAESISTGDFKNIGKAFLSTIQQTLQKQVADKLEDIFAEFFKRFLNEITASMNKQGGGGGGSGDAMGVALSSAALFFHEGGIVPGSNGSEVPIVAQAGEMVLTRNQQRALLEGGGGSNSVTINMSSVGDVSEATKRANREQANEISDMVQQTLVERGAL
jgi:hypothetical protein